MTTVEHLWLTARSTNRGIIPFSPFRIICWVNNLSVKDARGRFPSDGLLYGNWGKLGSYSSCLEVNFTFLLESKHDFRGQYCLVRSVPSYLFNGSEYTNSEDVSQCNIETWIKLIAHFMQRNVVKTSPILSHTWWHYSVSCMIYMTHCNVM